MREIREELNSDDIVVSLSLGKDSIATLYLCSLVFKNIYCMFGEQLPGRRVDVEYANYLRNFFPKIKCIRFFPHPVFQRYWNEQIFRKHTQLDDPFFLNGGERDILAYEADYESLGNYMLWENGITPGQIYQAVGVKMSDSLNRRIALKKTGYINHKRKLIYPVKDFSTQDVYQLLKYKNIKLHPDYKHYGSTFEGMASKYWVNAYRKDPETWNLIKMYFPMAETYVMKDFFKRRTNGKP